MAGNHEQQKRKLVCEHGLQINVCSDCRSQKKPIDQEDPIAAAVTEDTKCNNCMQLKCRCAGHYVRSAHVNAERIDMSKDGIHGLPSSESLRPRDKAFITNCLGCEQSCLIRELAIPLKQFLMHRNVPASHCHRCSCYPCICHELFFKSEKCSTCNQTACTCKHNDGFPCFMCGSDPCTCSVATSPTDAGYPLGSQTSVFRCPLETNHCMKCSCSPCVCSMEMNIHGCLMCSELLACRCGEQCSICRSNPCLCSSDSSIPDQCLICDQTPCECPVKRKLRCDTCCQYQCTCSQTSHSTENCSTRKQSPCTCDSNGMQHRPVCLKAVCSCFSNSSALEQSCVKCLNYPCSCRSRPVQICSTFNQSHCSCPSTSKPAENRASVGDLISNTHALFNLSDDYSSPNRKSALDSTCKTCSPSSKIHQDHCALLLSSEDGQLCGECDRFVFNDASTNCSLHGNNKHDEKCIMSADTLCRRSQCINAVQ